MSLRLVHPLDNPCSCGHALWLHTTHCIARVSAHRDDRKPLGCRCGKSLKELAS